MAEKTPDIRIDFLRATEIERAAVMHCRAQPLDPAKQPRDHAETKNLLAGKFCNRSGWISTAFAAHAENKGLVGLVCISAEKEDIAHPEPGSTAYISWLAVDPDFQHQGIATALMRTAEQHIADKFFRNTYCFANLLDGTKRNDPHSHFYEQQDYRETGRFGACGQPMMYKSLNRHAALVLALE